MNWLADLMRGGIHVLQVGLALVIYLVACMTALAIYSAPWSAKPWFALGLAGILGGYLYALPWTIQRVRDTWHRRTLRTYACPVCGTRYGRHAVRSARHLVKTKLRDGSSAEAFQAIRYELWELACSTCGHVQDYGPSGNLIPADGPDWPGSM